MAFATIFRILGWLLVFFAGTLGLPVFAALAFDELQLAWAFLGSGGLAMFAGGALIITTRGAPRRRVGRGEAFLLAALTWLVLAAFGALPFLFGLPGTPPVDAFFEALSGLTTTGATVFPNLDDMPRALLFWRALLQWQGGLATIGFALGILTVHGLAGEQIFQGTIPLGASDNLAVRLVLTLRSVWWIYLGLTVACGIGLAAVGMPAFDALCHAMATVSSGGFSTRDGSIGAFASPAVELVAVLFMVLAATNFAVHWAALHGRWRAPGQDPEFRFLVATGAIAGITAGLFLLGANFEDGWSAIGHGLFNAVSAITTTGFAVTPAAGWHMPSGLVVLLLALMLIGGSGASSGGGMKIARLLLLFKIGNRELARLAHPHGIVSLKYAGRPVQEPALRAAWSYFMLYLLVLALVVAALGGVGLDFQAALTAGASALTNTASPLLAPAMGEASYAAFPVGGKLVLAAAMLAGRLELFTLLALLSPAFWQR